LRRLAGRQDSFRASDQDRPRGLDQVAGALDRRQIEHDRAIAQRRQQPLQAKAQRYRVVCQGRLDELARELLRRALKHGLKRERGLVAGTLRPSPPPAAGRLRK